MLEATLFLLGLGLVSAVLLAIASRVFYVWEDPKLSEIEDALLGANCGGCGYPGCSAAAAAVVAGEAGAEICVAGGMSIASAVAKVMGVEIEVKEPEQACTSCTYGFEDADTRFTYLGINDCRAAALYANGSKVCHVGCMGLGTCVKACPFGALSMGDDHLPVVDRKKCRACGICVEVCPKGIMALTSRTNRILGDYTTEECTAPCQRECPTGIDIPEYIAQIREGNHGEAVRVIKEKNPLPLVCGRICPAPCEMECRRTLAGEAVAINPLKRFATEYEMSAGKHIHPYISDHKTGKQCAVIGGGAQGLTTAYYLACLGHSPTVMEASDTLGGIIRRVIPESRLPKRIIDWEIQGILDAGVAVETGQALGRDLSIQGLLDQGYQAVVLATGGMDSCQVMGGSDDSLRPVPGIHLLVDFMKAGGTPVGDGSHVCIVGSGSSTFAAALACLSNGARKVTIVTPCTQAEVMQRDIDPASITDKGVDILYSSAVCGLSGTGDSLQTVQVAGPDGEANLSASTVIVASGRISDLIFVRPMAPEGEEPTVGWTTVPAHRVQPENRDEDLFNLNEDGVFNDNVAVVRSIGRGRRMARAAHLVLGRKDLVGQPHMLRKDSDVLNVSKLEPVDETNRHPLPAGKVPVSFSDSEVLYDPSELQPGYDEQTARAEAERCLKCGLICYEKSAAGANHDQKQ
jgi:formate dehydrogenase (NADP+) beta subunit